MNTLEKSVQLQVATPTTATIRVALGKPFDMDLFDDAVEQAYEFGFELNYDSPSELTDEWEIWTLEPIFQER